MGVRNRHGRSTFETPGTGFCWARENLTRSATGSWSRLVREAFANRSISDHFVGKAALIPPTSVIFQPKLLSRVTLYVTVV